MFIYSLCCRCGVPIEPNPSNTCVNCLRAEVDITAEIPKQVRYSHSMNSSARVIKRRYRPKCPLIDVGLVSEVI